MRRLLTQALAILTLAAATAAPALAQAQAQDWQHYSDQRGHGAFVCPTGPHPSGQRVCFEIYCEAEGAPLEWHVTLSGYALDNGPQPLTIQVDGANRAALLMVQHADDDTIDLRLPFEPAPHEPLLHVLARGANGILYLGVGDNQITLPMSLKGSAVALSKVQPLCGHEDYDPIVIPDHKPKPQADYILGAVEVRDMLVGRQLTWENAGGKAITTYKPNGQYEGETIDGDSKRPNKGSWWLIDNGNVCWKGGAATGCFQFRQEAGQLHAYRVDGGQDLHLGQVLIRD